MNSFCCLILALLCIYMSDAAKLSNPGLDKQETNPFPEVANKQIPQAPAVGQQNINDELRNELRLEDLDANELPPDSDSLADPDTKQFTYESGTYFQGDIYLENSADRQMLEKNQESDEEEIAKIFNRAQKWDNGIIPYTISDLFSKTQKAVFIEAFNEFENHTCIRLKQRTNETDYVYFAMMSGCYSSIGRQAKEQIISIGQGCIYKYIIMHEIMHAAGFWHEMSRADRDDYIEILWKNIIDGKESNFQKYNWNIIQNLGIGYDTGSIMHYSKNAFARSPELITIKQIDKSQPEIGKALTFSPIDIAEINKYYNCKEKLHRASPAPDQGTGNAHGNRTKSPGGSNPPVEKNPSVEKNPRGNGY